MYVQMAGYLIISYCYTSGEEKNFFVCYGWGEKDAFPHHINMVIKISIAYQPAIQGKQTGIKRKQGGLKRVETVLVHQHKGKRESTYL